MAYKNVKEGRIFYPFRYRGVKVDCCLWDKDVRHEM